MTTAAARDAIWLDGFVKANRYLSPKPLLERPGCYACIMPLLFTHAIIVGRFGDDHSYEDRWCYHDREAAEAALEAWNGAGEPEGWHRHPATGRRRNEIGEERVA